MGEVVKPGRMVLTDPRVSAALSRAGGVTPNADDELLMLRSKDGSMVNPQKYDPALVDVTHVRLEGERGNIVRDDVTIAAGSTIFVPAARRFFISGDVPHSGAYKTRSRMTVNDALLMAGVPESGRERLVVTIRRKPAGQEAATRATLTDAVLADDVIEVTAK